MASTSRKELLDTLIDLTGELLSIPEVADEFFEEEDEESDEAEDSYLAE